MALRPSDVQLLVIDFQEKLFAAMPEEPRRAAEKAAGNLVYLFDALSLPVRRTEQYPQGLGPTIPSLAGPAVSKTSFSAMVDHPALLTAMARPSVVVCGMETHICVALTVLDLRAKDRDVYVVADACVSRRREDWEQGLALMQGAGAKVVPSETVLFALLERAGTPLFKEISRRIR